MVIYKKLNLKKHNEFYLIYITIINGVNLMYFYNLKERVLKLNIDSDRKALEAFLNSQGLVLDNNIEYSMGLYHDEKIIGTGSIGGKVLKCIAVDEKYKGYGLSNKIVSHLVNEQYSRGRTHLFIYTKPINYHMFMDMGFYSIAEVVPNVALLENDPKGINKYLDEITKKKGEGEKISSIVMNCNPFTLGHKYLIEKAASSSDVLHVFVVWEDNSTFPSEIRYDLIKKGTEHLSNVVIHKGKDYIISNATFPSYFMKESKDIVKSHALLDLKIFGEYIAPALGINKRFVGEEPYCEVTKTYNDTMKEILPDYGIELVEIPRYSIGEAAISASMVRKLLKYKEFDRIRELVPKSTYDFLISGKADKIIEKLKDNMERH